MDFFWLIPNKISGGSQPAVPSDFEFLLKQGIKDIISLIEDPRKIRELAKQTGINVHSIPIIDFSIPTHSQIQQFVSLLTNNMNRNHITFIHCLAGCGRTGMMLALYLVHCGYNATEAINKVRSVRPCSIESEQQKQIIVDFAREKKVL